MNYIKSKIGGIIIGVCITVTVLAVYISWNSYKTTLNLITTVNSQGAALQQIIQVLQSAQQK